MRLHESQGSQQALPRVGNIFCAIDGFKLDGFALDINVKGIVLEYCVVSGLIDEFLLRDRQVGGDEDTVADCTEEVIKLRGRCLIECWDGA